jgi:hypothetical protein
VRFLAGSLLRHATLQSLHFGDDRRIEGRPARDGPEM